MLINIFSLFLLILFCKTVLQYAFLARFALPSRLIRFRCVRRIVWLAINYLTLIKDRSFWSTRETVMICQGMVIWYQSLSCPRRLHDISKCCSLHLCLDPIKTAVMGIVFFLHSSDLANQLLASSIITPNFLHFAAFPSTFIPQTKSELEYVWIESCKLLY